MEVEQLRLQIGNLEADKTHLTITASAREELHHTEMLARETTARKR